MIAKFLLRRLPDSAEQDSLSFAIEAASVARHARPHDWARLRGELAVEAEQPSPSATGSGRRAGEEPSGSLAPSFS
ncbi:hypothetical protein [Lutibaculum baratangense]|uniref:Uncharacterized protein n=1 Tax=Lutibaculum baratangense AMV1 TaxID=631454 RepID=V4R5E8_9HYPH|nr:hypothetical protein [Lutibaculum baratangense]ESR27177.1 hypothetical protein N177_0156 [Lutibaculum baratangense AMV1]